MLVGQQFGPFTIDKELGSGAMGTVYRGRYTKTGQVMAIKIMAPGIGSTNAAAIDRFEREIAILKQLNHPNIVRFYGSGKQQGMRYFAMEFVDGESLDKVMSRRGRMTWEEVVELGKQLCSALQHAHEQGIIHRDLKPSNIMVLLDGTLKLTDFGIAKDMDLEGLTATNCTVGTASYMSPEQCKGERDLTHKSDLYSLGVMFYELVTGRKPFRADNAMNMFLEHVNGTFERTSRLVLDIPIWLDTLICQLLEKRPEQRPLDANMVATTLGSIKEKVETQQSAGVDTVRRRLVDRAPGQKRLDEEDKDAARVLMTGKSKPKRKRSKKPIYEKVWFQAIGLALGLGVVATFLYLAFRPPSADNLYRQAKAVMQSGDVEKQDNAIEPNGVISKYLLLYGKQDNEQIREVRGWKEQILVAQYELLLDKHMQQERENKPFKMKPEGKMQEDAFAAVEAEEKGDRAAAIKRWQAVKELGGEDSSWVGVAEKHLAQWSLLEQIDKEFQQMYDRIRNSSEEPLLTDEREREAFLAWRMENSEVGDRGSAKMLFQSLRDDTDKDPSLRRRWYLYAAWHRHELRDAPTDKDKLKDKVKKRLEAVSELLKKKRIRKLDARLECLDVLALYGQNKDMAKDMAQVVEEAKKFLHDNPI
ncbi:MAG TPA: serine/threonine-protein kinase [Gemmataceae bacterium]|nr:serine/threonine-protein kinase [Gemmataceae bacterium]